MYASGSSVALVLARLKTWQEAELSKAPWNCSWTMKPAIAKGGHWNSHTKDTLAARIHTDPAAASRAAAGMSSVTVLQEGPTQARVQWQPTCGVDVRQRTIASGSCCCNPLGGSRSCSGCCTGSLAANAHAMADRRDSVTAASALGRASWTQLCGRAPRRRTKCGS
jgi:hypothetical protein